MDFHFPLISMQNINLENSAVIQNRNKINKGNVIITAAWRQTFLYSIQRNSVELMTVFTSYVWFG